jgi:uncharacterized membrane protein YfcA
MEIRFFIVVGILFLSSLCRSTFGFGDAMIAMPLLTISLGIKTATPLVALIGTSIAVSILLKQWTNVDIKSAWRLIISSLVGIPIGLLYLKNVNEDLVKLILAFFIILFSVYNVARPGLYLRSEKYSFFFGLIGGILGGAYNTNGPPVIIYGTLRKWNPSKFRATLQGYFLPTGGLILIGHAIAGLWTNMVINYYLFSLPVVIIAIFLGNYLNKRFSRERFVKYIYAILIMLGIWLIVDSLK